ncbi:uncharacterized protein LY89DRAFT_787754 [Mollisia scopiformis]|uniref:Zn(2)-C6 fungal-type domain-containing protein n=1 Tax=Mollisia scopiformis TaxID=149040 RepID=A0A132BDQ1_MOLSC|nr:uncharacterized protein LY89DRAFT_787754 [Mollisia scopiformis]KUJ10119.1 hypothetical protein LY89DRAFT_787754 [Mollisia scopiformis]
MVTVRRSAPKSRHGCKTCKVRRVKCDENQPRCNRCVTTGRSCDGYTSESPTSSPASHSIAVNSMATSTQPTSRAYDLQKRRAFDFFRTETAPKISGHFGATTWQLILQTCSNEPVVSQAVVALGSLHERLSIASNEKGSQAIATPFPMRQYSQAISDLREYLSTSWNADINIILICALVHISIETLQVKYSNAVLHLEHSLQLIQVVSGISTPSPSDAVAGPSFKQNIEPELIDTFQGLDIHASLFQGMRPPILSGICTQDSVPGRLSSLREAHLVLNRITSRLYTFIRSVVEEYKHRKLQVIPIEEIAEAASIVSEFEAWDDRFQRYLHRTTSKFSRADQSVIDILLVNHRLAFIEASTCVYSDATIFDKFDAPFDEIVTLASNVIRARKPTSVLDFQLDIGIIQPLYRTALCCREPWTRQKAISLLRSITFQEGVWNAASQAAIAQVAIDRENYFKDENNPSRRVSEFGRVHTVGIDVIDFVKKTAEVILSQKLNGLDGPWYEHVEFCTWK